MGSLIEGVCLSPLRQISVPGGDVWHAMKREEVGYVDFGEAYFSHVTYKSVKAWKRHLHMTLNLVVPVGKILFVLKDERIGSLSYGYTNTLYLSSSPESYKRLTVPPGIWIGFQGLSPDSNILLNIADLKHDTEEVERRPLEYCSYKWE